MFKVQRCTAVLTDESKSTNSGQDDVAMFCFCHAWLLMRQVTGMVMAVVMALASFGLLAFTMMVMVMVMVGVRLCTREFVYTTMYLR